MFSTMKSWLGRKGSSKAPRTKKPRQVRLGVECLEDRCMPSTTLAPLTEPLHAAEPSHGNVPAMVGASSTKHAPAAPTFTATPVSSTQIDLAWNKVSGATGYLVDEYINGAWKQIGSFSSSTTSDAVTGLSPGGTYYFDVAADNSAGISWAADKSATTKTAAPAAPSFTVTAVSGTQINLAWSTVSGATGYLVDEYINGAWKQIGSFSSTTTSDAVTGLSPGVTYYFEVAADNSAGATWAPAQSATTFQAGPPAAPSFTATAVSSTQINLAWSTVSGATGYLVDEWINGAWTQIGSFGSGATSDAVTGLSPNSTYYFAVAAYNSVGTSWATFLSATTSVAVDHPGPNGLVYTPVSGSLFGSNGPSFLDVEQGAVGDCWLMASLAEVAARDPQVIESMFTYGGTTTENGAVVSLYSVRFFNSAGVAQYVVVDTELPSGGGYYDHPAGDLWAALAEKAYAQANGEGIVTTESPGSDSYNALNDGEPIWALQAITGYSASAYSINPNDVAAAWNAGDLIVLATSTPVSPYIVPDHAYAVVGYNASSSQPFQEYNPWGTNSSGWALGTYNGQQVYGLFTANAAALSQNFVSESFGYGAAGGIGGLTNGSPAVASSSDTSSSVSTATAHNSHQAEGTSNASAALLSQEVGGMTDHDGEKAASRSEVVA